jgi:hypothetical protein
LSIDGKTLHGSARQGPEGTHIPKRLCPEQAGALLGQQPVAYKTNEQGMIEEFLLRLVLEGCLW